MATQRKILQRFECKACGNGSGAGQGVNPKAFLRLRLNGFGIVNIWVIITGSCKRLKRSPVEGFQIFNQVGIGQGHCHLVGQLPGVIKVIFFIAPFFSMVNAEDTGKCSPLNNI